jgi:hypothetical protein
MKSKCSDDIYFIFTTIQIIEAISKFVGEEALIKYTSLLSDVFELTICAIDFFSWMDNCCLQFKIYLN